MEMSFILYGFVELMIYTLLQFMDLSNIFHIIIMEIYSLLWEISIHYPLYIGLFDFHNTNFFATHFFSSKLVVTKIRNANILLPATVVICL